MVRIVIDEPSETDPDLRVPLKFAYGCMARDVSVVGLAEEAVENCERLRARHQGNRHILNLSGVIAFIMSNREAAMRFWGNALIAAPRYTSAVNALDDMIDDAPHWADAADYLALAARGEGAVPAFYADRASRAFAENAYGEADRWLQRISAFNRPGLAQLDDLEACGRESQRLRDAGAMAETLKSISAGYQDYWSAISDRDIRATQKLYHSVPDRTQLATIVARLAELTAPAPQTILELGCFAGFNLQLAAGRLSPETHARTRMIGIEPNANACRIGAEISPDVEFVHGGYADLLGGRLDIPESFDICIVSRVFMILEPEFVSAILAYLAARTETLVICDDILNIDGQAVTVRMPGNFIMMHPFQQILEAAGFVVAEVIMSDVPDRECTGFIVAAKSEPAISALPRQPPARQTRA